MSTALASPVLVLNKDWRPIRVVSAAQALVDLAIGKVEAVDTDYQAYNFDSWRELSGFKREFEPDAHSFVRTVRDAIVVPAIVRSLKAKALKRPAVRLSRRNIYLRDNHTCQYTGQKLPASELNLDHVIPSSRGGTSTWENLVCCSVAVNAKKGNKTPKEAGLKLIRKPKKPEAHEIVDKAFTIRHPTWEAFVDAAYWNTELKD